MSTQQKPVIPAATNHTQVPVYFFKSYPLETASIYAPDAPGVFALIEMTASGPRWAFVGWTRMSIRARLEQLQLQPPAELVTLLGNRPRFVSSVIRNWGASDAAYRQMIRQFQPTAGPAPLPFSNDYDVSIKFFTADPFRPLPGVMNE